MFENLQERLERSFKILKGEGKITEINVSETVKDIRKALLDADVSYKVAKDFCNQVKDKAIGTGVLTAVNQGNQPGTALQFKGAVRAAGDPPVAVCADGIYPCRDVRSRTDA